MPPESTSLSEPAPVPLPSGPVDQLYAELEAKIREYRPKDDLAALQKAFHFARKYHEGQMRDSGEPYMAHPVMVAHILADMRMDVVAMETGLLHDVAEDTSVTVEQVRKEFGPEVARCVDGVTKLTKLDVFSAEDRQAESVRKMLLAMVEDIRVILVKLADRILNMRTLVPDAAAPFPPGARRPEGDGVKVRGMDNLMAYRAKCCNPIRGEANVGYVTRAKGVAVPARMFPNVQSLLYDVERKIKVELARAAEDSFPVRIVVHPDDRSGMLNRLTSVLSDENTNVRSLEAKGATDHDGVVVGRTVDVRDKKQPEKLVPTMRRISGVRDVERLFNQPQRRLLLR